MKYTIVFTNGRIIDPDNGIDMIGDIGLSGPHVAEIASSLDLSQAEQVIDAAGKWVIPGVIDPHMHVSTWIGGHPGLKMMAGEGVITALDMAGPAGSVFENVKTHGSGMNIACLNAFTFQEDEGGSTRMSDDEIKARIRQSLNEGAIGVKLLGGHYPMPPETTQKVIAFAAEMGAYVAFHAGSTQKGSNLEGMREAVELADGHPLHLAHINSYCRGYVKEPLEEAAEALALLQSAPTIWSESYLSLFNGTSGKCEGEQILSHVTRKCCEIKGYSPDKSGLGEAIRAGYGRVVFFQGGENVLITGEEGRRFWETRNTDVTLSFPVNIPAVQISLATMKNKEGRFIVNSFSTDGGGIPRNTMVRQGLDLVHIGAIEAGDYVKKICANTARMLGLERKGHLSPGADGDITVIDPQQGRASMGISLGKIIMIDGVVIGSGGTVLSPAAGEKRLKEDGVGYEVVDPRKALRKKDT